MSRKILVAYTITGSTANVISASFQFIFHHDRDNAGQHEDIFKNRDHARREHFIQRIDVGGHTRYQASHRVLVEEPDVDVLQVAENLLAQIEHHFLPGPLHQVGLDEFKG